MIRARESFALVTLCAILILLVFLAGISNTHTPQSEEGWATRIETVGGEEAYRALKQSVRQFGESQKHTQAHFFGGALYSVEGLDGLSVCDTQFSYGCFHEFLGRAIAELGPSSVKNLNDRCFRDLGAGGLACQHGIGHGVQAFFGYTEKDLLQALDACSKVAHVDPVGGCFGGVFMEYNFQTTLGEQAVMRTSGDMASPCDAVAEAYKESCVFSQPQWWYQVAFAPKSGNDIFSSLGGYCNAYAEQGVSREACYRGIGNIAPQVADYLPERTGELCTHTSSDAREQLSCLSNAANAIGVTVSTREAEKVCVSLSGEALSFCVAYAQNKANALLERPLPTDI